MSRELWLHAWCHVQLDREDGEKPIFTELRPRQTRPAERYTLAFGIGGVTSSRTNRLALSSSSARPPVAELQQDHVGRGARAKCARLQARWRGHGHDIRIL